MNMSPQIWQQFVDLVFQDDLIKRKQNFDVIMDDMSIHSTEDKHMDDLMDLFKVLQKYGLKISPHKCQYCYIVGFGLNCKFIDLLFKHSFIKFIEISFHLDFIVSEIICKQTDTLIQGLMYLR